MKQQFIKLKLIAAIGILSILAAVSYFHEDHSLQPAAPVYANGVINQHIRELAQIKQQPGEVLPDASDLAGWNAYLQNNFLRPAGADHQDISQMQQDPDHHNMLPLFAKLNMVNDINPSRHKYDLLFVFGGSPENTFQRFKFLSENIETKILDVSHNQQVIYINGLRKIHPIEIAEAQKLGVDCEYQHQCAQLIWDYYFNDLPLKLKIMTVEPPPDRRANTEDTLKAFYAVLPDQELYLLGYSNAPYVPYQADTAMAVAFKEHKDNLHIEVVGASSPLPVPTMAYTDSIARRVYTFFKLFGDRASDAQ